MQLKKTKRSAPHEITDAKRAFLSSTLNVILEKLKWDLDDDPDDMDEDDKAAFEELRKVRISLYTLQLIPDEEYQELRTFMDSTLMIDPDLVTEAVRTLALNTLTAYQNGVSLKWNDAELAVYLVYIFGEINKCKPSLC